jgi:hypothetical protein
MYVDSSKIIWFHSSWCYIPKTGIFGIPPTYSWHKIQVSVELHAGEEIRWAQSLSGDGSEEETPYTCS